MKLTDVSDASLSKIFDCFYKDLPTIARFARINDRFFNFAEIDNRFKMDFNSLFVSDFGKYPKVLLRYDKNVKKYVIRLMITEVPLIPALLEAIYEYQNKCASINKLILDAFVIDEELLLLLGETLKPLIMTLKMKHLEFSGCTFECTEGQLCKMLQALNVKEMTLNHPRLNQMTISNVLLSQIPDCLYLDFVCFTNDFHKCHDVDDQLLMNWLHKTPKNVKFDVFKNKITISGVLLFIEKFCMKVMSNPEKKFEHLFDIGHIALDDKSMELLALAQRNPNLIWTMKIFDQFGTEDHSKKNYTVSINNHDVTLMFVIYTKKYPKITKQQARNEIQRLRQKTNARRENGRFVARRNRDITHERDELLQKLFMEWSDLRSEIYKATAERIQE